MASFLNIHGYLPEFVRIAARFPAAVLAALALFLYANVVLIGQSSGSWPEEHITAGIAAFLAGGSAHLFAETRGFGVALNRLLAFATALIGAGVLVYARVLDTSSAFLLGALGVGVFLAIGMKRGASQSSLWLFDFRILQAAALATITGLSFAGGLSAVAAGLDFLLGMDVPSSLYERIWSAGLIVVGPLFGLSLTPRHADDTPVLAVSGAGLLEHGAFVLVSYVLVPLVVVYAAILHAYALKVLWLNNLPRGEIGTLVTLFALGGTATWLIAWPWRETGGKLLQLFMRYWFWLIPVPAILLSIAITRRISDYGITPDRYAVALVAIWAVIVFAYLTIRRNTADIRVVLGSAAALLLVGSFGPLSANSLTIRSQIPRLEALLTEAGLLKDGRIQEDLRGTNPLPNDEAISILSALSSIGALHHLDPWIGGNAPKTGVSKWQMQNEYALALGVTGGEPAQFIGYQARASMERVLDGKHRILGPFHAILDGAQAAEPASAKTDPNGVKVSNGPGAVVVEIGSMRREIQKKKILDQMSGVGETAQPIEFMLEEGSSLLLTSASGAQKPEPRIYEMTFWIIQRL
jgi:hypothetical protein